VIPKLELIVTQGPYSSFVRDVAAANLVCGIRLNTIMPVKEGRLREKLDELRSAAAPKTLWVDLKARQLRVVAFANTPYTAVTISHRIRVNLPATVFFDNGRITGQLADIDGHQLIIENYTGRMIGPGESVNIPDDSLEYLEPDVLTPLDQVYVELCKQLGIRHFMLSYVESAADITALRALAPGCEIMAKIENQKGLRHLPAICRAADHVMAARGDLYTEVALPHLIGQALEQIISQSGFTAVVASRLFESLLRHPVPSCPDMMDALYLLALGYRRFMIGDDICFQRDVLFRALRIFTALAKLPPPRVAGEND